MGSNSRHLMSVLDGANPDDSWNQTLLSSLSTTSCLFNSLFARAKKLQALAFQVDSRLCCMMEIIDFCPETFSIS